MKKLYYWKKQYSDGTIEYYVEYSSGKGIIKLTTTFGLIAEIDCKNPVKVVMFKEHDGVIFIPHVGEIYGLELKNFKDNVESMELDHCLP